MSPAMRASLAITLAAAMGFASRALMQNEAPEAGRNIAQDDTWAAPPAPRTFDLAQSYRLLSAQGLWTAGPKPKNNRPNSRANPAAPQWTFVGVVEDHKGRLALIQTEGKTQRYRPGERLPGDVLLASIGDAHIEVEIDGAQVDHRLFRAPESPAGTPASAQRSARSSASRRAAASRTR